MTLSYEDIFSDFLGYVTDYNIASSSTQDVYEMMREWLKKAIFKPYVRRLFSSVELDNEIQILTYEMDYKVDDETDKDFIIDVLAKGMVIEWLQPQVKNKLLTQQFFGTKEQKFYAQSNQLSELRGLLEDVTVEQRKMIRDRGYINNSYLED